MIEYENLSKLNEPFFDEYRKAFNETLESGWYILGNKVQTFEKEFAQYCDVQHCVGLANGLDALILALKAMNAEPGDEVIVPSNTYIATILAIVHNGLKPVLVEPDIATYNIDAGRIAERITSKTRAVIAHRRMALRSGEKKLGTGGIWALSASIRPRTWEPWPMLEH